MQPGFARAPIRIGEHHYFEVRWKLFDGYAQVVYFFSAIFRLVRDDQVCFWPRGGDDALQNRGGGIGVRSQYKKNFIVLMIKLRERHQVTFQAWFEALTGAEHRDTRRVESRIDQQPAADISKPLQALPDKVGSDSDLHDSQQIEEIFHAQSE